MAVILLCPLTAAGRGASVTWSGTWSTNYGTMTLTQSGRSVEGNYTHDQGHLKGTVTGNVLSGRWDEAPSRAGPGDAGPFRFTLSDGGKSFTGQWKYAGDPASAAWRTDWSGSCSSGPCSQNATTPGVVPIKSVSNGCGGAGWGAQAQNYLGNTSVYRNSNVNPAAQAFTVSFVDACDLHDAGYAGAIVRDKLRGGIKDFRRWTRKQVDDKFLADMRLLCRQAIPAAASTALTNCQGRGGNFSIGAVSRYNFVRQWGNRFFDADLTRAGVQRAGPRANN